MRRRVLAILASVTLMAPGVAAAASDPLMAACEFDLQAAHAEQVIAACTKYLATDPADAANAYGSRANAYADNRDFAHAIADYDLAIAHAGTVSAESLAALYDGKGEVEFKAGDLRGATSDLTYAIDHGFATLATYETRGIAFFKSGDFAHAIDDFSAEIRLNQTYNAAYFFRGVAYARSGDADKGLADLSEAIRLDPTFYEYMWRGQIFSNKTMYGPAVTDFTAAQALEPDNAEPKDAIAAVEKLNGGPVAVSSAPEAPVTQTGHAEPVSSVAFSPDGRWIVSGSEDKTLKLFDAATGKVLQVLEAHGAVAAAAFSPDGRLIASASLDGTVKLWDAGSAKLVRNIRVSNEAVDAVAFSPDGSVLATGSWDNTVRLWETATGTALKTFRGHVNWVESVAFSPDGKRLVSGSTDNTLKLWNVADGALVWSKDDKGFRGLAFSRDGATIASTNASADTVRLWKAATGEPIRTLTGHKDFVNTASFSPGDRTLVSGSNDGAIILWDLATGQPIRTFDAGLWLVLSVAFSPDGRYVVSGSQDKKVTLWDPATGKIVWQL